MTTLTTDSWQNPVTGVGGPGDKSANFTFVGGDEWVWDWYQLSDLYETDDIAAKIVNAVVDEAFLRDWSLEIGAEPEQAQASRDWFDAAGGTKSIKQARKWARLHGGGAVYIGSDDGEQATPLTLGGRLHFLTAYEASELIPNRYYDNPLEPNFGKVSHYQLQPLTRAAVRPIVHESRLILFDGVDTTKIKREQRQGWGGSVLLRPMKAIQQFNATFATVQALLADASQNVYKWKGLANMLAGGQEKLIAARLSLIDRARSSVKAIVVDAETEDFVRSQLQLGGIEGIMDKFMLRVSGAADTPATKLFGQAAAGLGATGEGDTRNWHDQVSLEQREQLEPAMDRALQVMFRAPNGPTMGIEPDSWQVKWPSQWAPTPIEEADISAKNAATDQTYFDMGALTAQQIAKARFTAGGGVSIVLTDAEIEAISPQVTEMPGAEGELSETTAAAVNPVDTADTDEVTDATAEILATKMTEHAVQRCEHGVVNRCVKCGIERTRDFAIGEDGQPVRDAEGNILWTVLWRSIGTKTPAPTGPENETEAAE